MICKGAKRPENHVRRFPVERRRRRRQKGCISHARKGGLLVFPRPPGRLYGFIHTGALNPLAFVNTASRRSDNYITPSEPARSVGGTHRSARSARTIEPGRRRRLNPPCFRESRRPLPLTPKHQKSTASAVLFHFFILYDVQWLLSPVPRKEDGGGWGGS